jgi:putative ABC transport system permease protein
MQFLAEAVTICITGGALGFVLGFLAGNSVSFFLGDGKFVIPWVWISLGLCISAGIFSGLWPAVKASRLDPVKALRF